MPQHHRLSTFCGRSAFVWDIILVCSHLTIHPEFQSIPSLILIPKIFAKWDQASRATSLYSNKWFTLSTVDIVHHVHLDTNFTPRYITLSFVGIPLFHSFQQKMLFYGHREFSNIISNRHLLASHLSNLLADFVVNAPIPSGFQMSFWFVTCPPYSLHCLQVLVEFTIFPEPTFPFLKVFGSHILSIQWILS